MSLATNITDLATRIATEVKSLRSLINGNAADLSGLTTTTKTNLVAAINEVKSTAGAQIDDSTTSSSKVWSSTKTNTAISSAVSALVDAAPGTLDTLNELAAALGDDANFAATITATVATKADASSVVTLTGAQTVAGVKTFSSSPVVPNASFAIAATSGLQTALDAKANSTDIGSTTTNFVTTFEAGLV